MKFENQVFERQSDRLLPKDLRGARFEWCTFESCLVGYTAGSPSKRRRIADVELLDCKLTGTSSLGAVVVERVVVENLTTSGLAISWGAVFRNVVVRGKCGKFMVSECSPGDEAAVAAFAAANAKFYETVDWALDISGAEFMEADIRGIPAALIRRDPETQVVVRRERVAATKHIWQKLAFREGPWLACLSGLLEDMSPVSDLVLVAPKRRKNFAGCLAELRLLQDAGVAEKD